MKETTKSTFENINDLISSILWPLLILAFFFAYRRELTNIIQLLLRKLELSNKFTVGSLSFEIEKTAKIYGNSELGKIIKNLSEESIRKLLTLGAGRHSIMVRGNSFTNDNIEKTFLIPSDYEVIMELEQNELIKLDEPFEDFLAFFKGLKFNEREQFKSKDGSSHDTRLELSDEKYTELSIPVSRLSDTQYKKIDSYGLILSETGQKAFDIIVKVISEQITKDTLQ